MLQTARALAEKGMAIFPCRPRDKRPATLNGLNDATTDPIEIENWWHQNPNYNIAIATGAVSGIFVVDLDGADAEAELRKLEAQHGELPATVESITGRGRHLFFKWPETPVRNSAGRIAPASMCALPVAMSSRRHPFIRAAGVIPGASIVLPVSPPRRNGSCPSLPSWKTAPQLLPRNGASWFAAALWRASATARPRA